MEKIKNILHPGVNKDDTQHYQAGVLDTTKHTTFEAENTANPSTTAQPVDLPNDNRTGIGMGYGAAEGVDTRTNQFENDMKVEMNQVGDGQKMRQGVGEGYTSPASDIKEDGNTMDGKFHKTTNDEVAAATVANHGRDVGNEHIGSAGAVGKGNSGSDETRQGIGEGYAAPVGGIGEGVNTTDAKFEKMVKGEMAAGSSAGGKRSVGDEYAGSTSAVGHGSGATGEMRQGIGEGYAAPASGIGEGIDTTDSKFEKSVKNEMATGSSTAEGRNVGNGYVDSSDAAGQESYATGEGFERKVDHDNTGVSGASGKGNSATDRGVVRNMGDQTETGTGIRTGKEDNVDGHSDPARNTEGPHSTYAANVLDPAMNRA